MVVIRIVIQMYKILIYSKNPVKIIKNKINSKHKLACREVVKDIMHKLELLQIIWRQVGLVIWIHHHIVDKIRSLEIVQLKLVVMVHLKTHLFWGNAIHLLWGKDPWTIQTSKTKSIIICWADPIGIWASMAQLMAIS